MKKPLTSELLLNQENLERVCLAFRPLRRLLVKLPNFVLASLLSVKLLG